MGKEEINKIQIKILETINYFTGRGYAVMSDMVINVLKGNEIDVTKEYMDCPTWSSLISCSPKRITTLTNSLAKNGYLDRRLNRKNGEFYLVINAKGKDVLSNIPLSKRRYKSTKKEKIEIVSKITDLV